MQKSEAAVRFDSGGLKKAEIVKAPMSAGYVLLLDGTVMAAKREPERVFKTIDAAVKTAEDIGFKKIVVTL